MGQRYFSPTTRLCYDSAFHGSNIPADAVKITETEHQAVADAWSNGKDIEVDEYNKPIIVDKPFDFVMSFQEKLSELASEFKGAMTVITGTYTAEDIASFPTQEAEAQAWLIDNAVSTPFLDALLANRPGIDKATLVQRITDNAQSYKLVAGPLIGKKQAYEDQLYALQVQHNDPQLADVTQADFDAIEVSFS